MTKTQKTFIILSILVLIATSAVQLILFRPELDARRGKIKQLEKTAKELTEAQVRMPELTADYEATQKSVLETLDRFPFGTSLLTDILLAKELADNTEISISAIAPGTARELYAATCFQPMSGAKEETVTVNEQPLSLAYAGSYENLSTLLEYLKNRPDISIETITIGGEITSGQLGLMLRYTDGYKEFVEPEIDGTAGLEKLFGLLVPEEKSDVDDATDEDILPGNPDEPDLEASDDKDNTIQPEI